MALNVLVCIPTLSVRGDYLRNCVAGYLERTPGVNVWLSVVIDAPTCGIGWNAAVERWGPLDEIDYIHFSNDDIVVGERWIEPMIAACRAGMLPAPRIEPAGVVLNIDPMPMPPPMAPAGYPPPVTPHGYFYADLPENQPTKDWQQVDHGALPFCSVKQWHKIGPFIPSHFGTDKWFYHRARGKAIPVVARQQAVIYNYAAPAGRDRGDWSEVDYLDFDLTVAYPMYVSGKLAPTEQHPLRDTPEGLAMVRAWRKENFG